MSSAPYNGDNVVAAIYGPSGLGKTTDLLYSFPNGLFVAPPGALKPAHHVVGHVPQSVEASTIMDATAIVAKLAKSNPDNFDAIVVDDFSLLAESTVSVLERRHTGFKLWGAVRDAVLAFRDTSRHAGLHVVMTAHESAPRTYNGNFIRGGPKLPGRLPEDFPGACDIVFRAAQDGTRRGWHACYRCTVDDTQWVTKDRHGVTPDKAPMNLGEIIRMAGYSLRRAPGLEWQEEIVEAVSGMLVHGVTQFGNKSEEKAIVEEAIELAREMTNNELHIRWMLRDALDRAALKRARANVLGMYL